LSSRVHHLIGIFLVSAALAQAQNSPVPSAGSTPRKFSPEDPIITLAGVKITVKEVEEYLAAMPPQYRSYYSGQGKAQLADLLITNRLMSLEAERIGLDKKKEVLMSIQIARESILVKAIQDQIDRETVLSDPEAQKYLDEKKSSFEEAKVKRIIIAHKSAVPIVDPNKLPAKEEAETKANDIRKKLAAGGDFEELAAKNSNDMMTSGKGGDMGYIRRVSPQQAQNPKPGQIPIPPPVEQVIFTLPIGSISEVIDGPFGFEIVKVEDRRFPKLADARKEIEQQIKRQKLEALNQRLREKAAIKVEAAFFKP
jgi:parvulin-like peptidyl-prolyl isomerase